MLSTDEKAAALGICRGRAVRQFAEFDSFIDDLIGLYPCRSAWHTAAKIHGKLAIGARLLAYDAEMVMAYLRERAVVKALEGE